MKTNQMYRLAAAALMTVAAGSVSAAQLIVTSADGAKAKGAQRYVSFDIASEGNVRGYEFKVEMPKGMKKGGATISSCLADVAKSWVAKCDMNSDGQLQVFVFSPNGEVLPAGVHSVGKIAVSGMAGKPRVYDLNIVDTNGNSITSSVQDAE